MSKALDRLRERNRREVELLSPFLRVGWHLPDLAECMLDAVKAAPGDRARQMIMLKLRVVAAMIDDIDGFPVKDAERIALARAFSPEHRDQLFQLTEQEPETATEVVMERDDNGTRVRGLDPLAMV